MTGRKGHAAPKAVYIHIPFCTNKCHYCDFNSYVVRGQPVDEYLEALEREMELTVRKAPARGIETVFVGGGTPTVLTPEQMRRFLLLVDTYFGDRADGFEFTMEANPGTTDPEKLRAMREGGVNRISFGAQTFDNGLLAAIGRVHHADDIYRSVESARNAGFANISIDLMIGLPRQTLDTLERTLDEALALALTHYSVYSLKIEENTLFHKLYERNELPLPDEEEELAMYLRVVERMREAGYGHYEISNFARPGFECRHNTAYWRNESYYGLGAGAHGYVYGLRHVNVKGIREYIEATRSGLPVLESFEVTPEESMEDFMMVGLRLLNGVKDDDFRARYGIGMYDKFGGQIARLVERGLLIADESGCRLSERGVLLGNEVFAEFIGG